MKHKRLHIITLSLCLPALVAVMESILEKALYQEWLVYNAWQSGTRIMQRAPRKILSIDQGQSSWKGAPPRV